MGKRVFLIVLDSLGIGELPDAALYHDTGSNTLQSIRYHSAFNCPNLEKLGLFHIDSVGQNSGVPLASYARMAEKSQGKDTTIGHFEIAGLISERPFPTYPNGFPPKVIGEFERQSGYGVLCNLPYSGTDVIRDFGNEHLESGKLIVYTSADSVFQIAAHEDKVPLPELYRVCKIARNLLVGEYGVGRVIARPFGGQYPFYRTSNRHDYSIEPPGKTLPDCIKEHGLDCIAVGKIYDIFAERGFTEHIRTGGNCEGIQYVLKLAEQDFNGLCFVNLVDFDMLYGHRNNVGGYAAAMTAFDVGLGQLLCKLKDDDVLIITADHGCDPATPSTDHSREYTPMLFYTKSKTCGVNLGTRESFSDIAATICEYFGISSTLKGNSFLKEAFKE